VCPTDSWYDGDVAYVVFDLRCPLNDPQVPHACVSQVVFAVSAIDGVVLTVRAVLCIGRDTYEVVDV
jgi:hypothetical protein